MNNERIDTSKYEGHTEGPWKNEGGNIHATNGEHIADTVLDMVIPQDEAHANTQLIADAPEILAELKRCYKLLDDADYAMSRYGEEEEHQDIDNVADAYEAVVCALAGLGRYC